MKRSRFTEEQIIAILREQEGGSSTADVCRKHAVSSATFYNWKATYGGMRKARLDGIYVIETQALMNRPQQGEGRTLLAHVHVLGWKKCGSPGTSAEDTGPRRSIRSSGVRAQTGC